MMPTTTKRTGSHAWASAYLADRLCGVTGNSSYNDNHEAYYKRYLKKEKYPEVNFHLIGHSHGGNVINEFTKRTAKSPGWPDHWKIKSIICLSTPFLKFQTDPLPLFLTDFLIKKTFEAIYL